MSAQLEIEQRLAEISEELKELVAEVGQHLAEKGERDGEQHAGMVSALESMGNSIAAALQQNGGGALVEAIVSGLRGAMAEHPPIEVRADVTVSEAVVKVAQQNVECAVTVQPNVGVQPVFQVPAPEVRIERSTWNDVDVEFQYEGARLMRARLKRIS